MELTSKALREAEFREKRGAYHPEDVDRLLEEVADGVDALNERLRQAEERAQRAEAAGDKGNEEALRRTLVLAQRTADMAVQEAREQASQIVASAEQQAQALLADAEERARRAHEEAVSEIRSELSSLEAVRQRGQQEVDLLNQWIEEHRSHLAAILQEALGVVERAGTLSSPPASNEIDLGPGSRAERSVPGASANQPPDATALADSVGQPTAAWPAPDLAQGDEQDEADSGGPARLSNEAEADGQEGGEASQVVAQPLDAPPFDAEEQAIQDFFENGDLAIDDEERRFGGRLRRRR